jgi:FMN reductase
LLPSGLYIDLATLGSDGLLGRKPDPDVDRVVDAMASASVLVIGTPTYRATYSGLLKVIFDRLPERALAGTACLLMGTAGTERHFQAVDNGLRALVASVEGWAVPRAVYATKADLAGSDALSGQIAAALSDAANQALSLASLLMSPRPARRLTPSSKP